MALWACWTRTASWPTGPSESWSPCCTFGPGVTLTHSTNTTSVFTRCIYIVVHTGMMESPVVKVHRRIRWHYTTTILRLRIGARLTRYRNCKFHNFTRTISRHADGISRYSVPPSAGPLLPLGITKMVYHNVCNVLLVQFYLCLEISTC